MALRSNLFQICLVSSSLAYGKLNAKNFGITLNILQLVKNFISRSAFFNFIDSFSNFCSCCVDILLYFCTMSCITLPNVLCDMKHVSIFKNNTTVLSLKFILFTICVLTKSVKSQFLESSL